LRGLVDPVRPPDDPRWVQDWTYFLPYDVVYLHRPHTALDFHIIERSKLLGVPLWIDLDDDLEYITADNPSYSLFANSQAKECIAHAIREADILTVGGECHAERLRREYKRDVILRPTALDDRLLPLKKPFKFSKKIAWRGSESHRTDLLYYQDELSEVLKKITYESLTFFGLNPYWLDWDAIPYQWVDKTQDPFQFYVAFTAHNACFHLTPMIDTEFNRVKSNLCWSDATLAGSIVFAPDYLPEYQRPGVYHYKEGSTRFKDALLDCFESYEFELEQMHNDSWNWITDNILMSKINKKRIEVLKNL
jgi:hypothetical protein